jgi:hypothetical protein
MTFELRGEPSDRLPTVLATGAADTSRIFMSMSARESSGRDAEYLEWHSLDHRPEQHRIAGLRQSLRVVSTPGCRAARAFSDPHYSAVDHVMTYFFAAGAALDQFKALSVALTGDRRPFRLPSVASGYFTLAGKAANPRAVAGADVIPWRPSLGLYLLLEKVQAAEYDAASLGAQTPVDLVDTAGVAGIWWHSGGPSPIADFADNGGLQVTYCFLDQDPVQTAERLREPLQRRWASGKLVPLFAGPFHTLVPFEWGRFLPG